MTIRYLLERPVRLEVDFSVDGFTVLLGNTGAGKTSLLLAIAGLLPAAGTPFGGLAPQKRPVGYLPQDYSLFPHLTALANVAYPLAGPDREGEARGLLARVGLEERASSYPRELSGGEQQRVALARALARKPALLLLDEPTSALDVATRDELIAEVIDLVHEAGLPALAVSHDPHLAQMADRVAVLERGRIVQAGVAEEVFARPATSGCARLVGFSNLYRATVAAFDGEDALLDSSAGRFRVRRLSWFQVGLEVCFGIRPEEVMTGGAAVSTAGAGGANRLTGELVRLTNAGLHHFALLRGAVDLQIVVSRHLQHALGLAVGQRLTVTLDPRYLHVIPAGGC